jgi:hypothetical protein
MGEEDQRLRSSCPDFRSYVEVLRSLNSHRPSSGFKGVHQRGPDGHSEARNSPFPVCTSLSAASALILFPIDFPLCAHCVYAVVVSLSLPVAAAHDRAKN